MMELYQIRYFLTLCETLNFARAAELCGVCQPSLTRAIQKMEHELGGLLIRRERRLTHLTELGRLVRPMLEEVVAHAEETKRAAHRFLAASDRPMRLGMMASLGPLRLAPFLARFCADYPGAELVLVEASAGRLQEMLLAGDLEVAVASDPAPSGERLRVQPLYRERLMVAFPAGHRFGRLEAVRLVELRDENFLLSAHCELCQALLDRCRAQGFAPQVVHRSERGDWVQLMIAAGLGVTALPEYAHRGPQTPARPLIEPELWQGVGLVTVAGRRHDTWVNLLLRAARLHDWESAAAAGAGRRQSPPPARARGIALADDDAPNCAAAACS